MELTASQKLLYLIIHQLELVKDKTKLAKLEYFSDFIHYAFHDENISGELELYQKREYGPLGRSFNLDLEQLLQLGLIKQRANYTYTLNKSVEIKISPEKKDTIQYVLAKYGNMSSRDLIEISHKQIPYLSTENGGIIDYDTAYNLVDDYPDYHESCSCK